MGLDRTGIGTSPIDSKELIEAAPQSMSTSPGTSASLDEIRREYVGSEPVGTVPVPSTLETMGELAPHHLHGQGHVRRTRRRVAVHAALVGDVVFDGSTQASRCQVCASASPRRAGVAASRGA
jgi:hypothetical protein